MPKTLVNGLPLYYEVSGSGPPLTLIMGLGCSVRQWQWLLPLLTPSFQVTVFDNRDAGRSGRATTEYTTDQFADDTAALLDDLQIKRSHILGISVGGMIAQKVALQHSALVDRLVLGCTMPSFFHHAPADDDLERLQQTQVLPPAESAEALMELFFTDTFRSENPEQCRQVKQMLMLEKAEQGPEAFMRQLGAAMAHDTVQEVKNISAATLILSGDRDPMAPVENSRFLAEQIADSTLVELPGIRHGFWIERAGEAADIITRFLEGKSRN
jgi:pimeloyl-ACP methyl ester carboxylesterase